VHDIANCVAVFIQSYTEWLQTQAWVKS